MNSCDSKSNFLIDSAGDGKSNDDDSSDSLASDGDEDGEYSEAVVGAWLLGSITSLEYEVRVLIGLLYLAYESVRVLLGARCFAKQVRQH